MFDKARNWIELNMWRVKKRGEYISHIKKYIKQNIFVQQFELKYENCWATVFQIVEFKCKIIKILSSA